MEYHQFLGQVQNRGRMATLEDATKAVRATLMTLGERLAGGEPLDLAAQLPTEIGRYLMEAGKSGEGERFGLNEFFKRVSAREGVDLPTSVFHARAVIDVLKDAVSPGEIADVMAQLPAEYRTLFKAGVTGEMPDRGDKQ